MNTSADPAGASKAALRVALLEFSSSPGKFHVALRQPQPLFASLREVLQIAVGRETEPGDGAIAGAASLRDAARFFVRTALLYPGADHYALLGLERHAQANELKDRYRLMMRLLHPDYSDQGVDVWPVDAAVRVNRAYDTLSSVVERRLYDETLGQGHAAPIQNNEAPRPQPIPQRFDIDTREVRFKQLASVCALFAAVLVIASMYSTTGTDGAHLVQRSNPPTETPTEALQSGRQRPPEKIQSVAKPQEAQAKLEPRAIAASARFQASLPPMASPRQSDVLQQRWESPLAATARPFSRQMPAAPSAPPFIVEPYPLRAMQVVREDQAAVPAPQPESKPASLAAMQAAPSVAASQVATTSAAVPASPVSKASAALVFSAPAPASPSVAAAPPSRALAKPGPTLLEAQPLLSQLLQVMESGRGERILNLLDADVRNKPSAQALSRQYESVVDGARPVRLSHVELKAEPGDGKLVVVGQFRIVSPSQSIGTLGKKMMLRAEFFSRDGTVVITDLSGGAAN